MTKMNKVGLGIFSFAQALIALNIIASLWTFIFYGEQGYLMMLVAFFASFGFVSKLIAVIGCLFMHIRGLKRSLYTRILMFGWYALPFLSVVNIFYRFLENSEYILYEVLILNGIMLIWSYAITVCYAVDMVIDNGKVAVL